MWLVIIAVVVNMKKINKKSSGFSLIELMVGILVGLIVIGGATSVFLSTVTSSASTLKMSKLNQELMTAMSVMAGDIRRAGFDADVSTENPTDNDFNQVGTTALSIRDNMANDALIDMTPLSVSGATSGECILYTYDQDKDGGDEDDIGNIIDDAEFFGFRLNAGVLEMHQTLAVAGTADTCNTGTWAQVTDGDLINITTLTFDLADSTCLKLSNNDGVIALNSVDDDGDTLVDEDDEINCYTNSVVPVAGKPIVSVESRVIEITLEGQLLNDALVKSKLSQTVRVRNDLVRIH